MATTVTLSEKDSTLWRSLTKGGTALAEDCAEPSPPSVSFKLERR